MFAPKPETKPFGWGAASDNTQQTPSLFGNTTQPTTNSSTFGTQQQQQQPFSFGSTSTTNNNTFGNNTQQQPSSLFGSTSTTNSNTFGANTQQKQPFSFGSTTTTNNTTFGNNTQQPQPSSLFGSTTTTTNNNTFGTNTSNAQPSTSLFGSTNTNTQQPSSFGTTSNNTTFGTAANTQQPTSLFGGGTSSFGFGNTQKPPGSTTSTFGSNTFGTNNQQQQQQQGLLSLQAAFPDTNVPYFIIRPDGINRTTFPSSFFLNERSTTSTKPTTKDATFYYKGKETTIAESINSEDKSSSKLSTCSASSPTQRNYAGKRKVLPGFLTGYSAQTTENARTGQKRSLDNNDDSSRRVVTKSSSSTTYTGIFGNQLNNRSTSFGKLEPDNDDDDAPPVLSLWHIHTGPTTETKPAPLVNLIKEAKGISDLDDQYIPGGVSSTVSVFGYPPEMVTDILTYFKQFGDISATTETAKNCVTITYTTPQAAQKAVEANGKVLPNNTMVGVTRLLPADIDRTPSNTIIKNNNSTPVDPSIFKPSSSSNGILGIFSSSEPSKPVPELTKLGQPVVKVGQENLFDKIKKYALTGW